MSTAPSAHRAPQRRAERIAAAGPRVLCLTPWWPRRPDDPRGSFIRDQVAALQRLGAEVDVIVVAPQRGSRARGSGERWVRCRWLPRYVGHGLEARALAWRLALDPRVRHLGDYDLVHAHEETCGIAAVRVVGDQVPIVVSVHGTTTDVRAHRSRRRANDLATLAQRAQVVLVGSVLHDAWRHAARPPVVVPNGFDAELFAPAPMPAAPPLRVLAVANLVPTKGVNTVIGAVARARAAGVDVVLEIVGAGPEARDLANLANRLAVTDHVRFLGSLGRTEVAEAMARCHLFCLPSTSEAFGIVYLEALGRGRPVVACRGQGAEQIVTHGEDGWLVGPHDVEAVTDILRSAARDPAGLGRRGEAAAARVRARFRWEISARKLLAVYRAVLA